MKLIYFPENGLAPVGGPAGYLHGLNQGLKQNPSNDVHFLPEQPTPYEKNRFLQRAVPSRIKDIRRLKNTLALPQKARKINESALSYDLIHFHETRTMYLCRDDLRSYDGIVVLTSHSPCVFHKELIDRLNPRDAARHRDQLQRIEIIDEYAFNRADFIIFPCAEAEEPYFHSWDNYPKFRAEEKLHYLPTGIIPATAHRTKDDVRKEHNIPDSAFVIGFVGRHNEMKGYDQLIRYGQALVEKDDDIWFLNAGKIGRIQPPSNERWIEVGWTNDPHSIMAAADVIAVPNKETYFDLAVLEALSLGMPIIASRTGGNQYFEKMGCEGISLFDNQEEFMESIARLKNMSLDERQALSNENKQFFEENHTTDVFASRYIEMTNRFLNS